MAAALALVLPAAHASAAVASAAQNGVGASRPETILAVGVSRPVSPVQSRGGGLPQAQFAAGLCVAAEDTSNPILFGQRSVGRFFTSEEDGSTFKFAGQNIADVASGVRSGAISPDELPIQYVVRDGQNIAINNRSLLALTRAGVDPTVTVDVTGDPFAEARITNRLNEMGGAPSETIRVRGAGSNASYLDWLW
jgi:filamentous hemagglutinin